MNFITLLDYVGTFAFAISGIRLASAKKFDWFGAYVVGFTTAIGGGTLRDVMLSTTPFWMLDSVYLVVTAIALGIVIALGRYLIRLNNTFFVFDAIGLGLFTVVGIEKTLAAGFPLWVAVIMGTITGAAGGVLRDILINEVPLIFRKEIYALACVFGGVVNEAIEKAKTADGFVFGSPVHYASASGNMTSFMDRLSYAGGKYLAYKPAAICCSARRAGTTTTLDQLVKYPQFFHMPLVNGSYWAMVHGSNAEQVLEDAEGCAVMQELGRNMAWMLHCIEAGKAAGFDHPQNPPRPMTNFIR